MPVKLDNNGVVFDSGLTQARAVGSNFIVAANGQYNESFGTTFPSVFIPLTSTQYLVIETNQRFVDYSTSFTWFEGRAAFGNTTNVKFRKGQYNAFYGTTGGIDTHPYLDTPNIYGSNVRWSHINTSQPIALDIYTIGIVNVTGATTNTKMQANGIQFHSEIPLGLVSNTVQFSYEMGRDQGQGLNTHVNLSANVGWQRIGNVLMVWGTVAAGSTRILVNLPVSLTYSNYTFMVTPIGSSTQTGGSDNGGLPALGPGDVDYTYDSNNNVNGFYLSTVSGASYHWMMMGPITADNMTPEGGANGVGT